MARVAGRARGASAFRFSSRNQSVVLIKSLAPSQGKPWYWAAVGCWMLVVYGFIPTLQPIDDFGRLYAVYGGFFIVLSYVWGARASTFFLSSSPTASLSLSARVREFALGS